MANEPPISDPPDDAGPGPHDAPAAAGSELPESPASEDAGPRVRRENPGQGDHWDDVPKIPYNRSLRLALGDLIRIAMFVTMLIALITLRPHCSQGAAGFIESFTPPPDAGALEPPEGYIRLTPEEVDKYFPRSGDEPAGEAEGAPGADAADEAGGEPGEDTASPGAPEATPGGGR